MKKYKQLGKTKYPIKGKLRKTQGKAWVVSHSTGGETKIVTRVIHLDDNNNEFVLFNNFWWKYPQEIGTTRW